MKQYLFILGRNFDLSLAELGTVADIVFEDRDKSLVLAENLDFQNPRNLPRAPEQLFLDRLGGVIRFGEVVGEFFDFRQLEEAMWAMIEAGRSEDRIPKVGFTVYGGGKDFLGKVIGSTKRHFIAQKTKIRIENHNGKNMSSGQLFDCRLIQKGHEFIIWKNGDSYLLVSTVGNQNIRNYELRDRKKQFRDAKMGMLPPKLAQILINLATSSEADSESREGRSRDITIIDPFCGSGTVNIEAGIDGFSTIGSDLNPDFANAAAGNFEQMAEKFRYEKNTGLFFSSEASQVFRHPDFKPTTSNLVVATEGFLGENFEARPDQKEIGKNSAEVLDIWRKFFRTAQDQPVSKLALCLPCWNAFGTKFSIRDKFEDQIRGFGFAIEPVFGGKKSFIYEREDTFVAREMVVVKKSL